MYTMTVWFADFDLTSHMNVIADHVMPHHSIMTLTPHFYDSDANLFLVAEVPEYTRCRYLIFLKGHQNAKYIHSVRRFSF